MQPQNDATTTTDNNPGSSSHPFAVLKPLLHDCSHTVHCAALADHRTRATQVHTHKDSANLDVHQQQYNQREGSRNIDRFEPHAPRRDYGRIDRYSDWVHDKYDDDVDCEMNLRK